MEILNFQDATVRTVNRRRKTFQTLQFINFDEALECLVIGDEVLAFSNCGRYLITPPYH